MKCKLTYYPESKTASLEIFTPEGLPIRLGLLSYDVVMQAHGDTGRMDLSVLVKNPKLSEANIHTCWFDLVQED